MLHLCLHLRRYAVMSDDPFTAWGSKRIYMECSECGVTKMFSIGEANRNEIRDWEACGGGGTLHRLGFAHPFVVQEVTIPEDIPKTSYATTKGGLVQRDTVIGPDVTSLQVVHSGAPGQLEVRTNRSSRPRRCPHRGAFAACGGVWAATVTRDGRLLRHKFRWSLGQAFPCLPRSRRRQRGLTESTSLLNVEHH